MVVVCDTGNNCLRLLTDTDSSLNGSVMRATSPEKITLAHTHAVSTSGHVITHKSADAERNGGQVHKIRAWMAAERHAEEEELSFEQQNVGAGGGGGVEGLA